MSTHYLSHLKRITSLLVSLVIKKKKKQFVDFFYTYTVNILIMRFVISTTSTKFFPLIMYTFDSL